jgi:putative two-component system response regulator
MNPETQLMAEYEQATGTPFLESLTGLFTHGFFQLILDREIKRYARQGNPFTLALIDLGSFSRFNRKHGYQTGDRLIKDFAELLRDNIRDIDWAARYQGATFALILVDAQIETARTTVERIKSVFREGFKDTVELFAGLSCFPQDAQNQQDLVNQALGALKQAKIKGGDGIFYFESEMKIEDPEKATILLVDDEPINLKLFKAFLAPFPYETITAQDGFEALEKVEKNDIDLILLDVMMPGKTGYEVCRQLKSQEETRLIPIVLVTGLNDLESRVKGMECGADDFLSKPVNRIEIIARTKSLIKNKKLNNRLTSIENVLFSLANAVEAKDRYTQGHTIRVATLAMALGEKMGLAERELEALRIGGMLHDIGKIGIPEHVLNKPGPLDPREWALMQSHAVIGYTICKPLGHSLGSALDVIRYHHEKMDQSGYPDGLEGPDIPITARIMAVVDIFDALTSDRPYRTALSQEEAIYFLKKEVEEGKLDQGVMDNLLQVIG